MKITIAQHDLNSALSAVARAMSGRSTLPVLTGIYLEATGSTLTVRATDMSMFIEKQVPCSAHNSGSAVIAGKALCDLVRRIPGGEVSITVGANHHAAVKWGKSEYNIPGFPAQDYPQVPALGEAETFTIGQAELKRLLQRTTFATGLDPDKPWKSNIVLEVKGGKLMVSATDDARIACTETPIAHAVDMQVVLGGHSAVEVTRLLSDTGEATVSFAPAHIVFAIGPTRIIAARMATDIKDVRRFIGFLSTVKITASRGELLEVIDRATIIAGDALRFDLRDGVIRVTPNFKDAGRCEEVFPAGSLDGDPKEVAINGKYLAEYLKVLEGGEVLIECGGAVPVVRISPVGEAGSVYVMAQLIQVKG